MAVSLSSLEDDLTCPVCCDVFRDPVVLKCSHSFCRDCMDTYWKDKTVKDCPSCRRRSSVDKLPANLSLRNIVEFYQKEKSKGESDGVKAAGRSEAAAAGVVPGAAGGSARPLCSQHGEKLQFFCTTDQQTICVVCQLSRQHRGHDLCPVEEAASDMKEEVKVCLNPLKQKLDTFQKLKQQCSKTAKHIQSQARQTESRIRKTFEELHHFLRVEESTRIGALIDETELKSVIMKEKIENLTKKIMSLSGTIGDIEKQIEAEDISFLKAYKQTKGRTVCTLQDPEPVVGALIDVATHLGSLKFKVWEKMLDTVQYTPVTLDPNTAACWLSLSDDLTDMRCHGEQPLIPENPERCKQYVLGAEGFKEGRHCWEVEVGNKTNWDIGVVKASVCRKGVMNLSQGYWAIALRDGKLYRACIESPTLLTLKKKPQRIRVVLDYEKGQVSFFDQSDTSHIYTFKDNFTEKLFPCFSVVSEKGRKTEPLKICPAKVSIEKM